MEKGQAEHRGKVQRYTSETHQHKTTPIINQSFYFRQHGPYKNYGKRTGREQRKSTEIYK